MDINLITEYISPIIVITCLGIGYSLHSLNNKILNSFIPIISAIIGISANVWSSGTFDLSTITTGLISGLASTGLYEAFKNMLSLPETYNAVMALPNIPYGEIIEDDEYKGKHAA